jgi:hypothetical protein
VDRATGEVPQPPPGHDVSSADQEEPEWAMLRDPSDDESDDLDDSEELATVGTAS